MDPCDAEFESLIGAYHDGELEEPLAQRVRQHLLGCPSCRGYLEELEGLSSMIHLSQQDEAITPAQRLGLHRAVDRANDRPLLRMAGTLSVLAASVLVVALAWLAELPRTGAGQSAPPAQAQQGAPPDWERLAGTLQVDPRVRLGGGYETETAEAQRITDWMLQGLDGRTAP